MPDWVLSSCPAERLSGQRVLIVMVLPALAPEGPAVRRWLMPLQVLHQAGAIPVMLPVLPVGEEGPGVVNEVLAAGLRLLGESKARAVPGLDGGAMPFVLAAAPGDVLVLENVCQYRAGRRLDPLMSRQLAGLTDVALCDDPALADWLRGFLPVGRTRPMPGTGWPSPVLAIVGGTDEPGASRLLPRLSLVADTVALAGLPALELERALARQPATTLTQPHWRHELLAWYDAARRNGQPVLLPADYRMADGRDEGGDLGPYSLERLLAAIDKARTVLWSGLIGRLDVPAPCASEALARAIAKARWRGKATAAAGDATIALIRRLCVSDGFQLMAASPWELLHPAKAARRIA